AAGCAWRARPAPLRGSPPPTRATRQRGATAMRARNEFSRETSCACPSLANAAAVPEAGAAIRVVPHDRGEVKEKDASASGRPYESGDQPGARQEVRSAGTSPSRNRGSSDG